MALGGGVALSSVEIHRQEKLSCVEIVPSVFRALQYYCRLQQPHFRAARNPSSATDLRRRQKSPAAHGRSIRHHHLRFDPSHHGRQLAALHPGILRALPAEAENRRHTGTVGAFPRSVGRGVPRAPGPFPRSFRTAVSGSTRSTPFYRRCRNLCRIDLDELAKRLERPAVSANLGKVELADPVSFLSMLVLDEEAVGRYMPGRSDQQRLPNIRGLPPGGR